MRYHYTNEYVKDGMACEKEDETIMMSDDHEQDEGMSPQDPDQQEIAETER